MKNILISTFFLVLIYSCQKDEGVDVSWPRPEVSEKFAGGESSVDLDDYRSFSQHFSKFNNDEKYDFRLGNALFEQTWTEGKQATANRDGLGPFFNARSCNACHIKDGRGHVPAMGEVPSGLLLRLSKGLDGHGRQIGDATYGGQLQEAAIAEYKNNKDIEGEIKIDYSLISSAYPDGTTYSLRKPHYSIANLAFGDLESTTLISPRIAPVNLGLGLIDAINEADILKNQGNQASESDGISGKVNYAWHVNSSSYKIGRYGWKANQPTVKQQVAAAFNGDMGITNSIFRDDCPSSISAENCAKLPNGRDENGLEISDVNLARVTLYSSGAAVPMRRDFGSEKTNQGQQLFTEVQCVKCHVASYTTSNTAMSEAFKNQTIYPYTDLLIHDMGEALADGVPEFDANGQEWKTPALWGLGLLPAVNNHQQLLHDGRADGVEEAILWHGGEAEQSKEAFKNLSAEERAALIEFVNSI